MAEPTNRLNPELTRRRFLQGTAFAGVAAFIAACTGGGGESAQPRLEGHHHDECNHDRSREQRMVGHVLDQSFHVRKRRGWAGEKGSALYRPATFSPISAGGCL